MNYKLLPVMRNVLFLFFCFFFCFCFLLPVYSYEDGIRIAWDYNQNKFVTAGTYARIRKLSTGGFLLAYSYGADVYVRKQPEGSSGWNNAVRVSTDSQGLYNYTNAELIELASGKLLYTWNARPKTTGGIANYKIMSKESTDGGATWSSEKDLYVAGNTTRTGCWEPVFLQLPSGELHLYFANEHQVANGDQNITLMRSFDEGETWGEPEEIVFRQGSRDGMPVPVYLQDEKGIAMAIEDNGIDGYFKPVITWTSAEENWSGDVVSGNSPNRWHALHANHRIATNIYAGAPYLIQLNNKETVLSCQSTEGRADQWTHTYSIMQVYIGDAEAKNFSRQSTPFPNLSASASALWCSLTERNDSVVTAIASIGGTSGDNGVWTANGKIIHPLEIYQAIDDKSKYGDYSSIYIGSLSQANLKVRSGWDNENLYFSFFVNDKLLTVGDEGSALWETDGIEIYLDLKNQNLSNIGSDLYKLLVNIEDKVLFSKSENGIWNNQEAEVITKITTNTYDYTIEVAIPWEEVGGKPDDSFGIHLKLHNNDRGRFYHENLSGGDPDKPYTWLKTTLMDEYVPPINETGMEPIVTTANKVTVLPHLLRSGERMTLTLSPDQEELIGATIKIYHASGGNLIRQEQASGKFHSVSNLAFSGVGLVVVDTLSGNRFTGRFIMHQ